MDRAQLFESNPLAASIWFAYYFNAYQGGMTSELAHNNLREHLKFAHRLTELRNFDNLSFGATYIDPVFDRPLRERVNFLIQEAISKNHIPYKNTPDPHHIAVVSGCFATNHSVWRNQECFIRALRTSGYRLTLVHCGQERDDLERSLFDDVKRVWMTGSNIVELKEILDNTFGLVYFCDVGMQQESVFLSNMRMAPVMVASYGHSSSTFGSLVDYWIGSQDVEEDITARTGVPIQDRYSEKFIGIPGWGVGNICPTYERRGYVEPDVHTPILIACSWFGQKVTDESLKLLVRIRDEVDEEFGRKVKFRLFSGGALQTNMTFLTFMMDVQKILGTDAETVVQMNYNDYMKHLEECAFLLDDPNYGGVNTIADAVWLGMHVVSRPGTHWRNSMGAAIAEKAGWYVPEDDADLVREVVYLINEGNFGKRHSINEAKRILCEDNDRTGRAFANNIRCLIADTYFAKTS
jgi:predicted O-linked N-acetylglucosamine transferase (SPINDLY family)